MDKQQARNIVRDTLGKPFAKEAFTRLAKELFNQIDESKAFHARGYVPESYKKYVKTYERLATYTDPDGLKIDILIVYLQSETTLERARTSQRNFIAHYLKDRDQKDAGLVAFVSPDPSDWRFSLVKMDYRFEEEKNGKVKVKEEFTPARRWSFLVGTNENSHTAQSRLAPIIADDTRNPKLAGLEEAFNIETVTKEFFTEYRNLFLRVKEALDVIVATDPTIRNNFAQNGVNTVDFAKKLLGQIVFLYFLQKKGWFGVARDAAWGTGSKHFLRELFEQKHGSFKNFFNDILEPLFYEALRLDRGHEDHYYSQFNCKIPFLNGGLFDPINGYDWSKTDILISNELFSNSSKTNKGDTGDGILDVFDRYNFTVKEDEPLEKEVAIDPELLGKAYEKFNAIRPDNFDEFQKALKSGKKGEESKFNKQFGVYYTPREIVHYMCQQSLINYLFGQFNDGTVTYEKPGVRQTDMLGNTGKQGQLDLIIEHKERPAIHKEDIETLIHYGERLSDNEEMALIKQQKINDGQQKTSDYKLQLPDSIRNNATEIDGKLLGIKVCDPAIGSGAFPVGMMSEIVRARNTLSTFIKNTNRSTYHFKRDCIENSLYGVDIDSGAVEIAKLRLWLSLVVDEDDIKNIKPLPNLDYKIVCGNSLLGLPADILPDAAISKEIEERKKQYFSTTSPSEKNTIRATINGLFFQLIDNIKKYDHTTADINFDFHTHFSEVFHEKDGFDIVMGNPPYVKEDTNKNAFDGLRDTECYQGKMDLWYLFGSKGLDILRHQGIMCFIATSNWISNDGASKFRNKVATKGRLIEFIDFGNYKVFSAGIQTMIYLMVKDSQPSHYELRFGKLLNGNAGLELVSDFLDLKTEMFTPNFERYAVRFNRQDFVDTYIKFMSPSVNKVVEKIKKLGIFHLSDGEVHSGIDVMQDSVSNASVEILGSRFKVGTGVFVISSEEKAGRSWNKGELEIIKQYYTTREINRYYANPQNQFWVLYTGAKINRTITDYPNIKKHLDQFKNIITSVNKPYGLHRTREEQIFQGNKILSTRKCSQPSFAYVDFPCYVARTFLIIKSNRINLKYLLGILNSKLVEFWLYEKGKLQGNMFQVDKVPLQSIPIIIVQQEMQDGVIKLVDKIISLTQSDNYLQTPTKKAKVKEYEKEIDQMVYTLYGLTPEEIKIVEGEK
jgi:hypothetical protein